MSVLDDQLRRWIEAGIIDASTAQDIRALEARQAARRQSLVIEALVYLALAIIAAGILVLIGTNWGGLNSAARIAIPGFAALAVLAIGWVMRSAPSAAVQRGSNVAWLLVIALVAATAAVIGSEAGWIAERCTLAASLAALAVALPLWAIQKSEIQLLGLGVAAAAVCVGVSIQASEDYITIAICGMGLGFGAAGVLLSEAGILVPQGLARGGSAALVFLGAFFGAVEPSPGWAGAVAFVAGPALIVLSVRRGAFQYMALGVTTLFVGVFALIVRHIENTTAAALTAIATGLILLFCIVLLDRLRPWVKRPGGRLHGGTPSSA